MALEITTPVGRLVGGHPMESHAVKDDKTKLPKTLADGVTPRMETYLGVAIPKGAETHWNQTAWGQLIHQAAVEGWPNGEHGAATFAWKVTDGDSQAPNRAGKKPCEREGYAGHWVVNCSNGFVVPCFHVNRYEPQQVIQNIAEIKRGDYIRVVISAKGNGPVSQSPGVYLNPTMVELSRAGIQIISESAPDAAAAFGGSAPVIPANAQVDTAVAQTAAPAANTAAVAPATDFLTPGDAAPAPGPAPAAEVKRVFNGVAYTEAALTAGGHTAAQIASYPIGA